MKTSYATVCGTAALLIAGLVAVAAEPPLEAIQKAQTPFDAVAAFVQARQTNPDDPALHEAFVRRMVDLGLPQLAREAAEKLTTLDPRNSLAWGVLAYLRAEEGKMVEGLKALDSALPSVGDDAFVLQTAGLLLAWYDSQPVRPELPEDLRQRLDHARDMLNGKLPFVRAYVDAKTAMSQAAREQQAERAEAEQEAKAAEELAAEAARAQRKAEAAAEAIPAPVVPVLEPVVVYQPYYVPVLTSSIIIHRGLLGDYCWRGDCDHHYRLHHRLLDSTLRFHGQYKSDDGRFRLWFNLGGRRAVYDGHRILVPPPTVSARPAPTPGPIVRPGTIHSGTFRAAPTGLSAGSSGMNLNRPSFNLNLNAPVRSGGSGSYPRGILSGQRPHGTGSGVMRPPPVRAGPSPGGAFAPGRVDTRGMGAWRGSGVRATGRP